MCFFFFKQKTAYEMRISDWSSDVCSSDLGPFQDRLSASTSVSGRACIPRWVRKQRVRQHRSGAETCRIHGDLWTDSPADSDETPPHRSTTSATIRFPKPSLARPDAANRARVGRVHLYRRLQSCIGSCSRASMPIRRTRRSLGCHRSPRSEEHTSELQSLMRIAYAVYCLK